eukprot:2913011-Karenia_brevis.AAC.1
MYQLDGRQRRRIGKQRDRQQLQQQQLHIQQLVRELEQKDALIKTLQTQSGHLLDILGERLTTASHASPALFAPSTTSSSVAGHASPVLFDIFDHTSLEAEVQTDQLQCSHLSTHAAVQTDQLQCSHLQGVSHASP